MFRNLSRFFGDRHASFDNRSCARKLPGPFVLIHWSLSYCFLSSSCYVFCFQRSCSSISQRNHGFNFDLAILFCQPSLQLVSCANGVAITLSPSPVDRRVSSACSRFASSSIPIHRSLRMRFTRSFVPERSIAVSMDVLPFFQLARPTRVHRTLSTYCALV